MAYTAYMFAAETPWWLYMAGAFLVGIVVPQAAWKNLLAVFVATFAVWGALVYMANEANQGLMAGKMAEVLPLKGSTMAIMLITAVVGGLSAGFAALTGSFLRKKAQ